MLEIYTTAHVFNQYLEQAYFIIKQAPFSKLSYCSMFSSGSNMDHFRVLLWF